MDGGAKQLTITRTWGRRPSATWVTRHPERSAAKKCQETAAFALSHFYPKTAIFRRFSVKNNGFFAIFAALFCAGKVQKRIFIVDCL